MSYIIRIPTRNEIGTSPSSVIAVTLMVATAANDRARGLQKYSLQEVAVDFVKFIRIIVYQTFRTNNIIYIYIVCILYTYICI